jgi:hypothetical protein
MINFFFIEAQMAQATRQRVIQGSNIFQSARFALMPPQLVIHVEAFENFPRVVICTNVLKSIYLCQLFEQMIRLTNNPLFEPVYTVQ